MRAHLAEVVDALRTSGGAAQALARALAQPLQSGRRRSRLPQPSFTVSPATGGVPWVWKVSMVLSPPRLALRPLCLRPRHDRPVRSPKQPRPRVA